MRRAVESWVLSWLYFALLMGELCVRFSFPRFEQAGGVVSTLLDSSGLWVFDDAIASWFAAPKAKRTNRMQ